DCTFTALQQPIPRILPHRFQKSIASAGGMLVIVKQALVRKAREEIQDIPFVHRNAAADSLGSLQVPSAREDGEPAEQRFLSFVQQVVAPVDQRLERLLSGESRSRSARKQAESLVEPLLDLLDRHRPNPRRG